MDNYGYNWNTSAAPSSGRPHPYHRQRHFYDQEQLNVLDAEFQNDPFPNRENRRRIAQLLRVPDKSVMWWFQNRRRRVRQQKPTQLQLNLNGSSQPSRHRPRQQHPGIYYHNHANSYSFVPEMTVQQPSFAEVQPSSFPQMMEQPVSTEENNWMVNAVPQQEVQHYPSHQNYYDYQSYPEDSSPDSTAPPSSFPTVQQQSSYYNDQTYYYHSNNNSATTTYSYDPNCYFNDYCYPSQTYC